MNQQKLKRQKKLQRRAKLHQADRKKAPQVKKTAPTPKAPRREKCGCEKRWNTETKKYEGYIMCYTHKEQFARILNKAAENLAARKKKNDTKTD